MTATSLVRFAAALALAVLALPAFAQAPYPSKPITVIVPFAAGGATDITARSFARHLQTALGQAVVVESKPGAGGNLGTMALLAAPADGHTILLGASYLTVNPALYPNAGYDTVRDLVPLGSGVEAPVVLVATPALAAGSVKELIALAKAKPRELNGASAGTGTLSHLALVLLNHRQGIDITHVPYRGSAPGKTDVMGGRVQIMFDTVASSLPQIRANQLKALAVTSAARVGALPDTPTMAEAGVADFVVVPWNVFFVHGKTPRPIVDRLAEELAKFAALPETKAFFAERGLDVISVSPAAFAERVARESAQWAEMVKISGAKPD